MIGMAALILALKPGFPWLFVAEILQGSTGGIITPAIAAISLGLVGRRAMSVRTGRNYRFSAGEVGAGGKPLWMIKLDVLISSPVIDVGVRTEKNPIVVGACSRSR
jgi:hypothetical protein